MGGRGGGRDRGSGGDSIAMVDRRLYNPGGGGGGRGRNGGEDDRHRHRETTYRGGSGSGNHRGAREEGLGAVDDHGDHHDDHDDGHRRHGHVEDGDVGKMHNEGEEEEEDQVTSLPHCHILCIPSFLS